MLRLLWIAVSAALLSAPDVTTLLPTAPADHPQQISPDDRIPVLPAFNQEQGPAPQDNHGDANKEPQGSDGSDHPKLSRSPQNSSSQADSADATASEGSGPITEQDRIAIIREVSGEFARMVAPLPAGKKGFRIKAGEPLDRQALDDAIRSSGAAVNPGDNVQITKLDFGGQDITLEINGGPSGGVSWRDRVHMTMDPDSPDSGSSAPLSGANAPTVAPVPGARITLDFGAALPNITPSAVKKYLNVVFDFSNQRSAAQQWTDSLPPEIREAIEQKRAAVGMDQDEVLAALGRPDRKVREQESDGSDTEDWIYGHPPTQTVFVLFGGEKVIKVTQYP